MLRLVKRETQGGSVWDGEAGQVRVDGEVGVLGGVGHQTEDVVGARDVVGITLEGSNIEPFIKSYYCYSK